jgi:hypothetical protein
MRNMRIFRLRKAAVFGAAAGAAILFTPTATMAANAAVIEAEGQGTISPPLTTTPQFVSGGFTTFLAVGGGIVGTTPTSINDSCTFTYAGVTDTIQTGAGTASGTCSGTAVISASLSYSRVGAVVEIIGSGTVNGVAAGFTATCAFVLSVSLSSFLLHCDVIVT